jgi:hypothetical protein
MLQGLNAAIFCRQNSFACRVPCAVLLHVMCRVPCCCGVCRNWIWEVITADGQLQGGTNDGSAADSNTGSSPLGQQQQQQQQLSQQ